MGTNCKPPPLPPPPSYQGGIPIMWTNKEMRDSRGYFCLPAIALPQIESNRVTLDLSKEETNGTEEEEEEEEEERI
jgi:hypothetical protein